MVLVSASKKGAPRPFRECVRLPLGPPGPLGPDKKIKRSFGWSIRILEKRKSKPTQECISGTRSCVRASQGSETPKDPPPKDGATLIGKKKKRFLEKRKFLNFFVRIYKLKLIFFNIKKYFIKILKILKLFFLTSKHRILYYVN